MDSFNLCHQFIIIVSSLFGSWVICWDSAPQISILVAIVSWSRQPCGARDGPQEIVSSVHLLFAKWIYVKYNPPGQAFTVTVPIWIMSRQYDCTLWWKQNLSPPKIFPSQTFLENSTAHRALLLILLPFQWVCLLQCSYIEEVIKNILFSEAGRLWGPSLTGATLNTRAGPCHGFISFSCCVNLWTLCLGLFLNLPGDRNRHFHFGATMNESLCMLKNFYP